MVRKGTKMSLGAREKMSAAKLGKPSLKKGILMSAVSRAKMSSAKKGKPAHNKGKPMPEHQKEILRSINKGRPAWNKGIPCGEDTKKKLSEAHKGKCGEGASNWQGGISFEPYCIKFSKEFKERVRKFFDNTCVECGEKTDYKLHVHHVNFDKQSCCNDTKPLFVSLCRSCHMKSSYNRKFWEYWFTEMIDRLYCGKCYLELPWI